ncbi:hypothetical protein EU805_01505 [Salipiger sp. IMCC34102]|uniref:hypothetical protein n=1 Tax=Salipiger sp. IMCC34102 TaxID=2510647 RepID=UPI00101D0B99|nr:hypothetical protein [Salipiger sp. IMCC34102]RYH04076.1 hypothetical protein EU805_01505 [Salipiger sp. IMCC34102]
MIIVDTPATRGPLVSAACFALAALAMVMLDWAMLPTNRSLTREGGAIEVMSMLGYVYAAVVYLRLAQPVFWPVPALLLFMAGREADADKRFTSEGILSTKILLRDTPLWEKLLAVGVWVLIVASLILLIRHRGPALLRALRHGAPWALAFAAGLFLAAFSKAIDGLGRKLLTFGIEVAQGVEHNAGLLEELLELLIPLLFLIAIGLKADEREVGPD